MKPKAYKSQPQLQLFQARLDQIVDHDHPLYVLSHLIDWSYFEQEFASFYSDNNGAPAKSIRLMVGLHYLKHSFNESDESLIERFIENPYWQLFCGFEYFQHEFPIDPSSMTRFRQRIGETGIEKMLAALLKVAKETNQLKRSDLKKVNVDTTVQEKAIAFPTDARLYHKMREALVRAAAKESITLRQNYKRKSKKELKKQGGYYSAKQMKRARRSTKKLKNWLGRVYRDIERKVEQPSDELSQLLQRAKKLIEQKINSKNKIYSIHAPEVQCIAKGKSGKRYEFGNKVSLATTSNSCWIIGALAFHGNPYDGHTLDATVEQVNRLTNWYPDEIFCDSHYRKHDHDGPAKINIVNFRKRKKLTRSVEKWFKRRSAIEPVIGHMKSDNRMNKNYLKGTEGDKINALLCACGFNLRKLYRAFLFLRFLVERSIERIKALIRQYDYMFTIMVLR